MHLNVGMEKGVRHVFVCKQLLILSPQFRCLYVHILLILIKTLEESDLLDLFSSIVAPDPADRLRSETIM